ncbi:DUF452 family protein [Volucribacter amazonae]|uniref:Biotin synthesis protein BioG n=1 Tax=Volucribacter amazonae TaxID=256731 RepID=A0A9X4PDD8_9PAST|nr:pimeloyl-ACP methyl esterase BioG family protein [Volucribacter amazonae]MDG6896102.1 hypothetical protein [Volucribacter amazonae]
MNIALTQTTPNATQLIIYFAGWGTPPQAVQHLALPNATDLAICYDYQDFHFSLDINQYQQIHLVAWSMGVWVAERVMQKIPVQQAIAINGTGLPMHDQYGIPVSIFNATLNQLSASSRSKFERRMCQSKELYQQYQQLTTNRSLNNIQQELQWLHQQLNADQRHDLITWNRAIIGEQDKIFPVTNLQQYWQSRCPIQYYPLPHYPFAYFRHWDQLLCP